MSVRLSRPWMLLCALLLFALGGIDCKSPGGGGGNPDPNANGGTVGGDCRFGPDDDPQDPTCEACASAAFGESTKSDPPPKDTFPKPDVTCDQVNTPKRMDERLLHARDYLLVKQPLFWLRDKERIIAHEYALLTDEANGAYLTDARVVGAIDGIRFVLDEVAKYRANFNANADELIDQLFEAREMNFAWWLKWGDPSMPSLRDHDDALGEILPYMQKMVGYANFSDEIAQEFLRQRLPRVRNGIGGRKAVIVFLDDYKRKFAAYGNDDASVADAIAKLKGDPWRLSDDRAAEVAQLLRAAPTPEQIYHGVQAYVGLINRELDGATADLRKKLLTIADLRRQGELPTYGLLKPASSYLRLEEVVQRYFDSSLVHNQIALFNNTADQLWDDAQKVTAKDDPGLGDDGLTVIASQGVALAMVDSLNQSFSEILDQTVILDCGEVLGKTERIPCYIDAEVLYLMGVYDVDRYEAAARNYVNALTQAYLQKAERIVSYDEYKTWRDAFRKSAIAKARDVVEHFWATQGCLTHQMAAKDIEAAREHNRIGTWISDWWNNPWNLDIYTAGGQLKTELRDVVEARLDRVVLPIQNARSISQIRDRSSDDTLFGILQGLANDLTGDAQRYVRDYVGNVSFYSNVTKTVVSVTVVTVATFAVPVTGGGSLVVAVVVVGTTSGVTEYVVSKIDNPDASFKESFARGFIAGAVPIPIAKGASSLIANIARNRAMSSMTVGGLRLLENAVVGTASGGVLYAADQKLQGKAIDLGELANAMAWGGGTGMALFAGETLFRLGRSANLRRHPPTEADLKPVLDKLGVDVSPYRNADGSIRWRAVYNDPRVQAMLASQASRTAFAKTLTRPQQLGLGQFMDGYGPLFVPPVVPQTDETLAVYRRAEQMRFAAQNTGGQFDAWTRTTPLNDPNATAIAWANIETTYTTSTGRVYRGNKISRMLGDAGKELDRKFSVFDARRAEALRIAIDEGDVRRALKYLTDPCFLKDINVVLNPDLPGVLPKDKRMSYTLTIDAPLTTTVTPDQTLQWWEKVYMNPRSNYRAVAPIGWSYTDSAGVRHGLARVPHVDKVKVKGQNVVYDVNDPKIRPFMVDQIFVLAEELQHGIQTQALDGVAIKNKALRDYLEYVLNPARAPAAERDAFLQEFGNYGLKGLVEIDIVLDRISMDKYFEIYTYTLQTFHSERWHALKYFQTVALTDDRFKTLFPRDWSEFCPMDKVVKNPGWPVPAHP